MLQAFGKFVDQAGDVAQLARALAWHARGQGFESPYLHKSPKMIRVFAYIHSSTKILFF